MRIIGFLHIFPPREVTCRQWRSAGSRGRRLTAESGQKPRHLEQRVDPLSHPHVGVTDLLQEKPDSSTASAVLEGWNAAKSFGVSDLNHISP